MPRQKLVDPFKCEYFPIHMFDFVQKCTVSVKIPFDGR
jgi:hypothetical protein